MPVPCPVVLPTAEVLAVLRRCGRDIGLSPQVLRTLEVLLSCLAPKRNHHTVFASNATLVTRAAGLSERSIRRHITSLAELGLLIRADSANGKRYCRHDQAAGLTLRFGLDFTPLFARFESFAALARTIEAREQRLSYLRCKLRAACQRLLRQDPAHETALAALKAARRTLAAEDYEAMIAHLPEVSEAYDCPEDTTDLSGTGGQNDRHQSNFSTELIDKEAAQKLTLLLNHCREAQSFAEERVTSQEAMIRHAERLAPMIGIKPGLWQKAAERQPLADLGALIWIMVQNLPKLANPGAYFQAVTIGRKAADFAPWRWLERQSRGLSADNCRMA